MPQLPDTELVLMPATSVDIAKILARPG